MMAWPHPFNDMPAFHGTHGEDIRCLLPVGHFYALDGQGMPHCVSKEILRKDNAVRKQSAPRRGQRDIYKCPRGVGEEHGEHDGANPRDFAYCVIRDYARCLAAGFSDPGRTKEAVRVAVEDLYGDAPCPFSNDDLWRSMKSVLKVCAETGFDYPGGEPIGVGNEVRLAIERAENLAQQAPEPQVAEDRQGNPRGFPPELMAMLADIAQMWQRAEAAYPEFFRNGRLAQ